MNTFDFNTIDTPAYFYDLTCLHKTLKAAKFEADKYNYNIHYALKANNNSRLLSIIQSYGFGADCVSGAEISMALQHHFDADQIFFAGIGKTDEEILLGLKTQIACFNIESLAELQVIGDLAKQHHLKANIALRINPNLDAKTHQYITTGKEDNKFGIPEYQIIDALKILVKCKNLKLKGLHFHIGSQITDFEIFKKLSKKVNYWNNWFYKKEYDISILNVGGGLGVDYINPHLNSIPDFGSFFRTFNNHLEYRPSQKIHFELGRSLVASCGNLITKVLYIKEGLTKKFAIVDAGMTEFIRPALYQAIHHIEKIEHENHNEKQLKQPYDVVGPICESTDFLRKNVTLPKLQRGDLLTIRSAGAYGEVMASRYNLRKQYALYFKEN